MSDVKKLDVSLDFLGMANRAANLEKSETPCPKCGDPLWIYRGETKREYDSENRESVLFKTGEPIPCGGCANRVLILMGMYERLLISRHEADAVRAEDKPNPEKIKRSDDRRDEFQKAFNFRCEEWQIPVDVVIDTRNRRKRR